jgi:beta-phosphoglucomutase
LKSGNKLPPTKVGGRGIILEADCNSTLSMKKRKAFIFDMDGTMFDNMQFHLQAWEKIVGELGSDLKGEKLFKELYGRNTEVLDRIFGNERFSEEQKQNISKKKDEYFREFYGPHLQLIPGLHEFLHNSREQGVLLGIGTAGLIENIAFALDTLNIRDLFSAIVCEGDVKTSKPDPETFTKAAKQLGVDLFDSIVFEDVPKGVEAADNAGMKAVVILTSHKKEDFSEYKNVLRIVKDYTALQPEDLLTEVESFS